MMNLVIFSSLVLASTLLSTAHTQSLNVDLNPIRLLSEDLQQTIVYDCQSWRWAVETNNLRDWKVVPKECVGYVTSYMVFRPNSLYRKDLATLVTVIAKHFATLEEKTVKDVVVFDLSETLLSNLQYYSRNDVNFGAEPFNSTKFAEWVNQGKASATPYMKLLYDTLLQVGYKIVIITGSSESYRNVLETNLVNAGYKDWFKFILKKPKLPTKVFKEKARAGLVEEGYNIVANIGDQWRDITGLHKGSRTFKVPNPMYYLG